MGDSSWLYDLGNEREGVERAVLLGAAEIATAIHELTEEMVKLRVAIELKDNEP